MTEACENNGTPLADVSHLDKEFEEMLDYLAKFKHVLLIGPADESTWATPGFDGPANRLMDIIRARSGAMQYSGTPVLSQLTKKNEWHFAGTHENYDMVICMIHDAIVLWRYLRNVLGIMAVAEGNVTPNTRYTSRVENKTDQQKEDICRPAEEYMVSNIRMTSSANKIHKVPEPVKDDEDVSTDQEIFQACEFVGFPKTI